MKVPADSKRHRRAMAHMNAVVTTRLDHKDWTVEQIAGEAGISTQTAYRILADYHLPTIYPEETP